MDNLVNHGEVSVNQDYAGGIVGMVYGNTRTSVNITKSRNVGNISGKNRVGGIVGGVNNDNSAFPSLSINGVDNWINDTAENISTTPDNTEQFPAPIMLVELLVKTLVEQLKV